MLSVKYSVYYTITLVLQMTHTHQSLKKKQDMIVLPPSYR